MTLIKLRKNCNNLSSTQKLIAKFFKFMKLLKNLHILVIYLDGEMAFIGYTIIATTYKLYVLKSHSQPPS